MRDSKERRVIQELQEMVGQPPENLAHNENLLDKLLQEPWAVKEKIFGILLDESGHVQGLILYRLGLENLPENIGDLTRLLLLWAPYNTLKWLPNSIGSLFSLKELSLSFNVLKSLPEAIGQLSNLEYLNLSGNLLESLPETFGNLTNLEILKSSHNQLRSLPTTFGQLSSLIHLELQNNKLKDLPEAIGQLSNLEYLNLSRNQLRSLPETIGQLRRLRELVLSSNNLRSLPSTFGQLSSLVHLELQDNQLKVLPETFGELQRLRESWLHNNWLRILPETFGQLQHLQKLSLSSNNLRSLPATFRRLTNLKYLNLRENPLKVLDATLLLPLKNLESLYLPPDTQLSMTVIGITNVSPVLDTLLQRYFKKRRVIKVGSTIFLLDSLSQSIHELVKETGIVDCEVLSREWSVSVDDLVFVLEHHVGLKKMGCDRERYIFWNKKMFFEHLSSLSRKKFVIDFDDLAKDLQLDDTDALMRIVDQWLIQNRSRSWRSGKKLISRERFLKELTSKLELEGFVDLKRLAESFQLEDVTVLKKLVDILQDEKELKATRMGCIVTTMAGEDILRLMQSTSEEWEKLSRSLASNQGDFLNQELLLRARDIRERLEALEHVGRQLRNEILLRGVQALKMEIHDVLRRKK